MIADLAPRNHLAAEDRERIERLDYELRFAIAHLRDGRLEIRAFASPQDPGTVWLFSSHERELLVYACAAPGLHTITRDDAPDERANFPTPTQPITTPPKCPNQKPTPRASKSCARTTTATSK